MYCVTGRYARYRSVPLPTALDIAPSGPPLPMAAGRARANTGWRPRAHCACSLMIRLTVFSTFRLFVVSSCGRFCFVSFAISGFRLFTPAQHAQVYLLGCNQKGHSGCLSYDVWAPMRPVVQFATCCELSKLREAQVEARRCLPQGTAAPRTQ